MANSDLVITAIGRARFRLLLGAPSACGGLWECMRLINQTPTNCTTHRSVVIPANAGIQRGLSFRPSGGFLFKSSLPLQVIPCPFKSFLRTQESREVCHFGPAEKSSQCCVGSWTPSGGGDPTHSISNRRQVTRPQQVARPDGTQTNRKAS